MNYRDDATVTINDITYEWACWTTGCYEDRTARTSKAHLVSEDNRTACGCSLPTDRCDDAADMADGTCRRCERMAEKAAALAEAEDAATPTLTAAQMIERAYTGETVTSGSVTVRRDRHAYYVNGEAYTSVYEAEAAISEAA